jgi:4-carboxymuconolactone decarboxylase
MKQPAALTVAMIALAGAPLHGQQAEGAAEPTGPDGGALVVLRTEAQSPRQAPAEHFSGSAVISQRFQARAPGRASGAFVTFEPGARTAWHSHPLGQTLLVTSGVGRVQRWGDPVDEIRPGDVVWIPAGQKHWHGASPTTSMTHVAISERLDGKTVEWMEKVTDEEYGAPVRPQPAPTAAPEAAPDDQPTRAQQLMGDFAPRLTQLTDDVLYAGWPSAVTAVRVAREVLEE